MRSSDTIAAIATGVGGAISTIRISGIDAVALCDKLFKPISGKSLAWQKGYTLHYGYIVNRDIVIDDVIVSLFKAPHSYTGEDMVEISCHGSSYIQQEIIKLLIEHGARSADAGEFTIRAFLAGKIDLSQAEAVADMIASRDKASHSLASNQMRGGYSSEFAELRNKLIELVSLLELELDFGEEDVEFADRTLLLNTISAIELKVNSLLSSFSLGNAIKEGVGVAIVGRPNVGKSTLLNTLLQEDRAMVSDIAGTTRDIIEESLNINGVIFRFIDTAGIRATEDQLEKMGIERTFGAIDKARIVLLMIDASFGSMQDIGSNITSELSGITLREDQKICVVLNKTDLRSLPLQESEISSLVDNLNCNVAVISAKSKNNIEDISSFLTVSINADELYNGGAIVSNSRHYEALLHAQESLARAHDGMLTGLAADLLSQDIREAVHNIGTITGEITTDDILGSIFSKFCIGK